MNTASAIALTILVSLLVGMGVVIRLGAGMPFVKFVEHCLGAIGVSGLFLTNAFALVLFGYGIGCLIKHFNP